MAQVIQALGVLTLRALARFCYRVRLRKSALVPDSPCVLASNHRSFLDPPFIGMWRRAPISYFARADLWRIPIIGAMLRIMHGIPVERENPGLSSMKGAVERLRQGISVLVFPEGTRTRTGRLGPMRDGPALFARRAGVPVVPVYVHHTERAWPRGALLPRAGGCRLEIRFGRPLLPPPGLPAKVQDAWVTARLRAWMVSQERQLQGATKGPKVA